MLWFCGGPEVGAIGKERDGAVIKDAAVVIAPRCVDDAHWLDAIHASRDDAVHQLRRIWAADAVLAHWRDVKECGGEADRMVFQVVRWEIRVGDEETRPLAPAASLIQFGGTRVERRFKRHATPPLLNSLLAVPLPAPAS